MLFRSPIPGHLPLREGRLWREGTTQGEKSNLYLVWPVVVRGIATAPAGPPFFYTFVCGISQRTEEPVWYETGSFVAPKTSFLCSPVPLCRHKVPTSPPNPSPDNWLRVYIPPDILQNRFRRCGAGRKIYRLRTERGRIGNYAYIRLYPGQHS